MVDQEDMLTCSAFLGTDQADIMHVALLDLDWAHQGLALGAVSCVRWHDVMTTKRRSIFVSKLHA